MARAAPTLLGWTMGATGPLPPLDLWRAAFSKTFAAELRAERLSRSASIVDSDRQRFERFGEAALRLMPGKRSNGRAKGSSWWKRKQLKGKLYSIPRLAKASATFAGGPDYIAWKINRHAGTNIELKPWQRRWPLITALIFLPRLLRSGAVR